MSSFLNHGPRAQGLEERVRMSEPACLLKQAIRPPKRGSLFHLSKEMYSGRPGVAQGQGDSRCGPACPAPLPAAVLAGLGCGQSGQLVPGG